LVTAREAANAYRGQPLDMRTINEELRVRYLLKGSMRRLGTTLHINVQLISSETGAVLWSERFDEEMEEVAAGQEEIVRRMKDEIAIRLMDIESARSLRERPTDPDAFDLVLRARSIRNQPPSRRRDDEVNTLLERALLLDPCSVFAMTYIAFYLTHDTGYEGWQDYAKMQRTERLLARARALAPESPIVINTYLQWLRIAGRCGEAIDACQRAIRMYPNRIRGMMNSTMCSLIAKP
jgi:hypothetical protein